MLGVERNGMNVPKIMLLMRWSQNRYGISAVEQNRYLGGDFFGSGHKGLEMGAPSCGYVMCDGWLQENAPVLLAFARARVR